MNTDLALVALMGLISLSALVGAVNSGGSSKMIVSYLLAFACLAITAFFLTQYFLNATSKLSTQIAGEAQKIMEEKYQEIEQTEQAMAAEKMATAEQSEVQIYVKQLGDIVESSTALLRSLHSVNLRPQTDGEYEQSRSTAGHLLNKSEEIFKSAQSLRVPQGEQAKQKTAEDGVESMRNAAAALYRFFKAENGEEESRMEGAFRARASEASKALRDIAL